MKDNFSRQSTAYAQFRPRYPDDMLQYILNHVPERSVTWDVGTGNGQVAMQLANHFQLVYATDISQSQLSQAPRRDNIYYQLMAAEEANFAKNQFDLVTVAQALHWFDLDRFYPIVQRSLKPGGIMALLGYTFLYITPAIEAIIRRLYAGILNGYWDAERKHVEEGYRSLPFPFSEINTPEFRYYDHWTLADLLGYLNTWSAVQHYQQKQNRNPVDVISDDLSRVWGTDKRRQIYFSMFLRLGKNPK